MFQRIGLITNLAQDSVKVIIEKVINFLNQKEREIILDTSCASLIGSDQYPVQEQKQLGRHCDLVIAIGGDGTMLMAACLLVDDNVPLLGVNLGKVGFLADINASRIEAPLGVILEGEYVSEKRFLLHGEVYRDEKCIYQGIALNDIVIQKWNVARLIELQTYVNKVFLHKHHSDGMIIATPTGSTAYALSGGGPIIHPSLDAMLLVPVCPHTLSNRPIVLSGDSEIEIIVNTDTADEAHLTLDGDSRMGLSPNDRIYIKKKDHQIVLIHPPQYDQFHVLREKLRWNR